MNPPAHKAARSSIVGRQRELTTLFDSFNRNEACFIAVYGRRRIGKTFLIREFAKEVECTFFSVTGQKDGALKVQLAHFKKAIETCFYSRNPLPELTDWNGAFTLLVTALRNEIKNNPHHKYLIFLDELPWLCTKRSGLLEVIDHTWNHELSSMPQVKLVVCGSAASWIVKNILRATGGLHNRVTGTIALQPFNLGEAKDLLRTNGIDYAPEQLIDTYLAFGGVPYYLKLIRPGESPSQAIDRLCFGKGQLHNEFNDLFKALFSQDNIHQDIIKALAKKRSGLTRKELLDQLNLKGGGSFSPRLEELEEAGFITQLPSVVGKKSSIHYRVIDSFTLFHLQWIKGSGQGVLNQDNDYFIKQQGTQAYDVWSGFAFENLVFQHLKQIKAALGLSTIPVVPSVWRTNDSLKAQSQSLKGAQIDLVLDRSDGMISLCEIKYSKEKFSITKAYAENLQNKMDRYREYINNKKSVSLVMITPSGLVDNQYSKRLIANAMSVEKVLISDLEQPTHLGQ